MSYCYYHVQLRYPQSQNEAERVATKHQAHQQFLQVILREGMQTFLAVDYSELHFYVRCKLEIEEFSQTLRRLFSLGEGELEWNQLPAICPTQWTKESPFEIPFPYDRNFKPKGKNIQQLFQDAFPTDEPLKILSPTAEELELLDFRRRAKEGGLIGAIVLYCGYAESARVAPLIIFYQGKEPLTDPVMAMKALAKQYLRKYRQDRMSYVDREWAVKDRLCCLQSIKEKSEQHFCHCSRPIHPDAFDAEAFQSWLYQISGENCDGYGGDDLDGWWEFDGMNRLLYFPPDAVVEIGEYAEIIIAKCISPDDLTGESRERHQKWLDGVRENHSDVIHWKKPIESISIQSILQRSIKRVSQKKDKFSTREGESTDV